MRTIEGSKACCAFCNTELGADHQMMLTSAVTGVTICQPCTTSSFFIFERQDELRKEAVKLSEAAGYPETKRDDDDNCLCPGCHLKRLIEHDPIIKAIDKAMAEHLNHASIRGTLQ